MQYTLPQNLDKLAEARLGIAAYFGITTIDYDVFDMRTSPWFDTDASVNWWESDTLLAKAKNTEPDYGEDIYGTGKFKGKDFTMFYVWANGGKEALIFSNKLKVDN